MINLETTFATDGSGVPRRQRIIATPVGP
ncbi:hypothetical protein NPIL_577431, partial [Nephila pilipes]